MSALARLLVRVFFRRIDVEGAAALARRPPLLLVANHVNGLVDGLVLMAVLPRYPRFLGKATLYRILPLAPFLHLAGVVPVHRAKDAAAGAERAVTRNDAAFRDLPDAPRRRRGLVAVFPEGISHDEARLQPLRTGAARIALGAAFDDGVTGVDDPGRRPHLRRQGPLPLPRARAHRAARGGGGVGAGVRGRTRSPAVRALTDRLGQQLGQSRRCTTPARTSWPTGGWPRSPPTTRRRRTTWPGRSASRRSRVRPRPPTWPSSTGASERYESDLSLLGLSDDDLARGLTPADYRRRIGRSVLDGRASPRRWPPSARSSTSCPYQIMKQDRGRARPRGCGPP